MAAQDLTAAQIESRVGTRHPVVGFEYPPRGLQPYYTWLVRALQHLADASLGALRVAPDADIATAVHVAPGRATVAQGVVAYAGGEMDLAPWNNDTALVYLESDGQGGGQVAAISTSDGEPSGAHLKLAEVTLAAGAITAVLDRRLESVFRVA